MQIKSMYIGLWSNMLNLDLNRQFHSPLFYPAHNHQLSKTVLLCRNLLSDPLLS